MAAVCEDVANGTYTVYVLCARLWSECFVYIPGGDTIISWDSPQLPTL